MLTEQLHAFVDQLAKALELGRVDKLNPDSDTDKQYEGGEALDQLIVSGGDAA